LVLSCIDSIAVRPDDDWIVDDSFPKSDVSVSLARHDAAADSVEVLLVLGAVVVDVLFCDGQSVSSDIKPCRHWK